MEKREAEFLEFILSFIRDFEGDYVLDGLIVDNPDRLLVVNYTNAKHLLNKWGVFE